MESACGALSCSHSCCAGTSVTRAGVPRSDLLPPRENVQLLSRCSRGVCSRFAEPGEHEGGLGQDEETHLGRGPRETVAMQASEIAMFLGVAEVTFDHRTSKPSERFGLRRVHPLPVSLDQLLPFQSLDRSALLGIANATLAQRTGTAVLCRAVKSMLDHFLIVAPAFPLATFVLQSMSHRTRVGLLLRQPLKLVLAYRGLAGLGTFALGEVVLVHRS